MSASFQFILEDLSEIEPIDPIVSPIPYDDSIPIPARIPMIFRQLLKAKRMNNRILILEKAFYIGQLIEEELTLAQRTLVKTTLSEYYYRVCVWTYCIFEVPGIQQIYRTKNASLTLISRLKAPEYRKLASMGLSLIDATRDTLAYESLNAQL